MSTHFSTLGGMDPQQFLTMLWGDPPPAHVYIYMLPTKRSMWFEDFSNVNAAVQVHQDKDIYTSVGLGPLDNSRRAGNQRVQQIDITGIAGLWADIDVAHEVHSRDNLPPTIEKALEVLELAEFEADPAGGQRAWNPGLVALHRALDIQQHPGLLGGPEALQLVARTHQCPL